jgi:hypothetical protein
MKASHRHASQALLPKTALGSCTLGWCSASVFFTGCRLCLSSHGLVYQSWLGLLSARLLTMIAQLLETFLYSGLSFGIALLISVMEELQSKQGCDFQRDQMLLKFHGPRKAPHKGPTGRVGSSRAHGMNPSTAACAPACFDAMWPPIGGEPGRSRGGPATCFPAGD